MKPSRASGANWGSFALRINQANLDPFAGGADHEGQTVDPRLSTGIQHIRGPDWGPPRNADLSDAQKTAALGLQCEP